MLLGLLGFSTGHRGLLLWLLRVHRPGRLKLGLALPRLPQHELTELLTLNLPVDLVGQLADML